MISIKHKTLALFLICQSFLFLSTSVNSATVSLNFSGEITEILNDTGSSSFSGLAVNDIFSGEFTYGQNESDASSPPFVSPPSAFWLFEGATYGASLTTPMGTQNTPNTEVIITNNDVMGIEAAQFVTSMTGINVSAGDLFDAWEVSSFDINNNIGISLLLLSLDSNLYNNLGYQTAPSSLGDIDLALLFVQQLNNQGEIIYDATGVLNQVSTIPLPPAIYLFMAGLFSLFIRTRV